MPQLASKPTNHFYDSFNLMNGGAGTDLNNTTHANYKEVDPPESAEIVSVDEE